MTCSLRMPGRPAHGGPGGELGRDFGPSPRTRRPGHGAVMTRPSNPIEPVDATRVAAGRRDRHQHPWAMTRAERTVAFFRGDLTLGDCTAWSRRYPDEPPTGPCGEYLYILATDPDWLGET